MNLLVHLAAESIYTPYGTEHTHGRRVDVCNVSIGDSFTVTIAFGFTEQKSVLLYNLLGKNGKREGIILQEKA